MAYDKAQLAGLEREIVRIANVEAAAIRLDAQGAVEAVDVIADRGRSPQRIVRDVEIILRRGGLDIDHRKIGVAALDAPGAVFGGARRASAATRDRVPEPEDETEEDDVTPSPERPQVAVLEYEPDSERVRLVAVHSTTRGGNFSVEVELAVGAYEGLPGRAEGPASEPVGCAALVARDGGCRFPASRRALSTTSRPTLNAWRRLKVFGPVFFQSNRSWIVIGM